MTVTQVRANGDPPLALDCRQEHERTDRGGGWPARSNVLHFRSMPIPEGLLGELAELRQPIDEVRQGIERLIDREQSYAWNDLTVEPALAELESSVERWAAYRPMLKANCWLIGVNFPATVTRFRRGLVEL